MSGPSGDRMIRVNMTNQTASVEPFPEAWKLLGGRALSARILLDECDPTCDPLGPDNLLVIAPGVMARVGLSREDDAPALQPRHRGRYAVGVRPHHLQFRRACD